MVYGTAPEYNGATPVKEGDAQYSYRFNGWEIQVETRSMTLDPNGDALNPVTKNITYKATFTQIVNEYTVTWKNEDGSVLAETSVPYGSVPTYNGIPTKEGNAEFSYTFAGWAPEVVAVTGNAEYTATYTEAVNSYTVTWNNWDGSQLDQQVLDYGETPEYTGEAPVKEGNAEFTYTFTGWDIAVAPVTGDITYTAQFSETRNSYEIQWKDEDGTVLETATVQYGEMPGFSGQQPQKEADAEFTYTFAGWTPEIVPVTGNAEYTATYSKTVNTYTVTWVDTDGTTLETDEKVPYGTTPTFDGTEPSKAGDAQYSYTFSGWTPEIAAVTGNVTYKAV